MKNTTKKAFGQMFKVMCDTSTYYPKDDTWENLIANTTNGGWRNPSGYFHCNGNSPDIEGIIIGFYIPPSTQKNHPKFAFIKGKKGRFAIKFGEAKRQDRNDKNRPYWLFFFYMESIPQYIH